MHGAGLDQLDDALEMGAVASDPWPEGLYAVAPPT